MDALTLSLINNPWIIPLIVLWTIPWKAVALWRAVKNNHKKWFIFLLILNTAAVLEIIYIFFFSKNKQTTTNRES